MTLDTTVRRVNYQGNDSTTCFPFPFKVWGEEQVVVYCSNPATPWTETNITNRTTVTLNEDNYGGAVVFANAPASGVNLAIVREGSFLQEDEYLSGSRFDAHEIEDRFDEDAAERQELLDATARSIKVPNSSTQTPEEVYEELVTGAAFVNNALADLNEKIDQANYWYNIIIQGIGDVIYTSARETSFVIDKNYIVDDEGEYVHSFTDGFIYYPATHQLLVTVDGLALTPEEHFEEVGSFGEASNQIRFKINIYQGQQVYIKAMFLGTEEFNVKLQEMDNKIAEANEDLQNAVDAANADFEAKTNELNEFVEETTDEFQSIIEGLDEEIAQTESLIRDALEIVGTSENWGAFQDAITELNSIYSTFTANELPTQGWCELDSAYYGGSCLTLPGDVCYFKGTNTLHLAIDGLVLSPKYFEEVGGCICTPSLVEEGLQDTFYCGANFVKIPEGVCLYKGQELHAWTESFWGREGWEPEEYRPDITTRLYATSTSGYIYHSDDLGRTWSTPGPGSDNADGEPTEQLPEYLRGQRIVVTSDTLWAFAAASKGEEEVPPEDDNQEEDGGEGNGSGDDNQEENGGEGSSNNEDAQESEVFAAVKREANATPPEGTLMCSTDGGLTWDCYIKDGGGNNGNGWQPFFCDPYAFAATDNALVLATCNGIFCCGNGGTWNLVSSLGSNPPFNYCWGLIEPASDGSGFLAVDTMPWPEPEEEEEEGDISQEENTPAPKRRQIVYFGSASSGGITYSCTGNISDVTAIAGNGQYWVIADACGQVEYTANYPSSWQTGCSFAQTSQDSSNDSINCIYGAREGFVALGCGASCTASPRNAWKGDGNGTLCAGLHLPDHGLYLAIGGDTSCSYTLWGWDGLNWNCGCGVPNSAVLNNIWTSEHLPFFTNEPVTGLEAMWPKDEPDEEPEPDEDIDPDSGSNDTDGNEHNKDDEQEDNNQNENGEEGNGEEGGESQEESPNGSGIATIAESPAASEHCYLWGPISRTYQLKSDLSFDSGSIPVRITIDQGMPGTTGNDHGNGATIAIYKSDTYQRLTREDILPEAEGNGEESQEESPPQMWCEFARYEACGPICANTELYTCFAAAGQDGSGSTMAATESYPTCWPAGYYAAAIYNVYGGCSLQKYIPNINFYVSRKERFSNAEGLEEEEGSD